MALLITITGNELYDFIKVDPGSDDSAVSLALAASKGEAEQFLNTDFSTTDELGVVTPVEAPTAVKMWVFNRVGQLYENRGLQVIPDYSPLQSWRVYPFRG